MKTQCPHCNAKFRVPNEYIDKEVKCTICSQNFRVSVIRREDNKIVKTSLHIIILLILIVTAFFVYLNLVRPNICFTIREVYFGDTPAYTIISPDGNRVATIKSKNEKAKVIVDGIESGEYDIFPFEKKRQFEFSPDSQRFAYTAKIGTKEFIVIDGNKQEIKGRLRSFSFSPDGSKYAYIIKNKHGWFGWYSIFVDGVKETAPEASSYYGLTFSPEGNRLAYGVFIDRDFYSLYSHTLISKGYRVILDGVVERESLSHMGNFVFSADSKRLGYIVTERDKSCVVVDGNEGDKYDKVFGLQRLPADGQFAYLASSSKKFCMVIDGEKGPEYDDFGEVDLVLSPDGKRFAYAAKLRQKWLMVVDGIESDEFDKIGKAVFSPDSRRVMFIAMRDDKLYVILDNVAGNGYDEVGMLTFSPDSKRIAYVATREEKQLAVVDGTEYKEYDGINFLVFSPDSRRIAFSANVGQKKVELQEGEYEIRKIPSRVKYDSYGFFDFEYVEDKVPNAKGMERIKKASGKWFVNIDGKETKKYDMVANGTFSPNGKHFLYWAKKDDKWLIIIDGQQCAEYDSLVRDSIRTFELYFSSGKFVFDSPNVFHTLACGNGKIFRVEIKLETN